MTDSGWLHYRDLKSRCPVCKRPAHIAKRNGNFYFVDDEYNPFVRHAPVKTTEAMIGSWCDAYERGEFPEGERTVGEVVMGRPPLSAEKTTTVTVKIPVGMKATLTKKAEERGTTMSAYVRSVLANDILAAS